MLLLARPDSARSLVLASLPPSCVPIIALPAFGRETGPHLHEGAVANAASLHEQSSLAILFSLEMVNVMAQIG